MKLKNLSIEETKKTLINLIKEKGYSAADIAAISDFKSAVEINDFNRIHNQYYKNSKDQSLKFSLYYKEKLIDLQKQYDIKTEIETGQINKTDFSIKYNIPLSHLSKIIPELFNDKYIWNKGRAKIGARSQKINFYENIIYNINNIPELNFLKYLISKNTNKKYINISNLVNGNIINLYEEFFNYNNFIDNYPNGLISSFIITSIKNSDLQLLENLGLIYIDNQIYNSSNAETLIENELKKLEVNFIKNDRKQLKNTICDGQELDFYLPDINIGIEVNPSYTHNSNKFNLNKFNNSKPKDYHYNKYLAAKSKGISLIQLYNYDLYDNNFENITIPRLKSRIGRNINQIHADETYIQQSFDIPTIHNFISSNNLIIDLSGDLKYLIYHKKSKEIIGFFELKFINNNNWKLINVIMRNDYHVSKIINKIIKYIKQTTNIKKLIAYTNNDWYDGKSYQNAGFKFIEETGPNVILISNSNSNDIITDNKLIKNLFEFPDIQQFIEFNLKHQYDNKSGYDIIFRSGYKKWIYNFN